MSLANPSLKFEGAVDLRIGAVNWNADADTLHHLMQFTERILYTAKLVCAELRFHRLSQVVWMDGKPKVMSVSVEAVDCDNARLSLNSITEFQPETVFGEVAMRAFENSKEVFLLSDANPSLSPGPQVIYVNRAFERMTGYRCDQLVGSTPRILQGQQTDPQTRAMIRDALAAWKPVKAQVKNYRKSGECFDVELNITPITDSIGWYVFWFSSQRDVTEENRQQAERNRLARAAGFAEGAGNALHNIGNVLNSVLLTSTQLTNQLNVSFVKTLKRLDQLLQQQDNFEDFVVTDPRGKMLPKAISKLAISAERQLADIEIAVSEIKSNADHIAAVISDQQDFARRQANTELIAATEVLDLSLAACTAHIQKQSIAVAKRIPDQLPLLRVNKHKVIQILANLIKNASEAIPETENAKITCTVSLKDPYVTFGIADNGIGIEPEKIGQIFDRGYTTKSDGCGFGLHSCLETARELGGDLTVMSEGRGCGSTFELTLPINPVVSQD